MRSVAIILALAATAPAAAAVDVSPVKPPFHDEAHVSGAQRSFGHTRPGNQRLLVTFSDRPSATAAARRLAGLGAVRATAPQAGVFAVTPGQPATARARALRRAGVEAAEWALERHSDAEPSELAALPLLPVPDPVDPLLASQWWLKLPGLWRAGITGSDLRPRIAILDGGIDVDHEEWGGPASPLVEPYSTYPGRVGADDWGRSGHGTHVAGIAAAPANGVGVVGAAPALAGKAEVIPVQIADQDGRSTDETMIEGIRWAVQHEAKVINISAGGPGYSRAFQRTVDWATARGALIVASVGNEGDADNILNYPAAYAHVLGVGAICDEVVSPPECPDPYGLALFTNHNRSLDVLGPGVKILSSLPLSVTEDQVQPGYGLKDGTSMAAPFVAGVAALVFGTHPKASPYQVLRHIQNTAEDMGVTGRDDFTGYGKVNPEAAVTLELPLDDRDEPNDDIPARRATLKATTDVPSVISARADRFDDAEDVYPVFLRKGQRMRARIEYTKGFLNLYLWQPGTRTVVTTVKGNVSANLLAFGGKLGQTTQSITVVAPRTGRYFLNVFARRGGSQYTLTVDTKPAGL